MPKNAIDQAKDLLLDAARSAQGVAGRIRETTKTAWSDGYKARVQSEIAALNVQQNAAGKVLVAEGLFNTTIRMAERSAKQLPGK
jgi:hypothetical protein